MAGTAASIYLRTRPQAETLKASGVAPSVPHRRVTTSRPPAATRRPAVHRVHARSATHAISRPEKTIHPEQAITAGISYQARSFPLALRITPPDGTWAGAQWTTSSHGRPAFGWAAAGRLPVDNPRGVITIETAFGPTPSAAVILARLRSAGREAIFGKTAHVSVAGFPGLQIDGRVVGKFGHVFVPFTAKGGGATPADSYMLEKGEKFRIVVLDVRGTRIVLFLESLKLPRKEFPAFLSAANEILKALEFPG